MSLNPSLIHRSKRPKIFISHHPLFITIHSLKKGSSISYRSEYITYPSFCKRFNALYTVLVRYSPDSKGLRDDKRCITSCGSFFLHFLYPVRKVFLLHDSPELKRVLYITHFFVTTIFVMQIYINNFTQKAQISQKKRVLESFHEMHVLWTTLFGNNSFNFRARCIESLLSYHLL